MCTDIHVSEIELSYKPMIEPDERYKIHSSLSASNVFRKIWAPDMNIRESSYILLINQPGHVIGWHRVCAGGIRSTVVDIRLIFGMALKSMATKLIIAHNHPSGELMPGIVDKQFTEKIVAAGKLLEIEVLDHMILTNEGYFSFMEKGLI